jgi:hypothetical protein
MIEYQVFQFDGNGARHLTSLETLAVREDGSRATVSQRMGGTGSAYPGIREVMLPSAGVVFAIDPAARIKLTRQMNQANAKGFVAPVSTDCATANAAPGAQVTCGANVGAFWGQRAQPVHVAVQMGTKSVVRDMLVCPDLDWLPLQITTYADGKMMEQRSVSMLRTGDPDPQLFVVPSDYASASLPSDFMAAGAKARGSQPSAPNPNLDRAFQSHK